MKKNSIIMWGAFLVLISAFVYDITFAGIPYPADARVDLQQKWEFHRSVANTLYIIGGLTVFLCLNIALISHMRNRKKKS